MADPIWKDYFVNLGSADEIAYTIRLNNASGELIYSGKAYKRPGETYNKIRINEICADYISHALSYKTLSELESMIIPVVFYISTSSASWSVSFYNNWSYDFGFTSSNGLNAPIKQVFVDGQIIYSNPASGSSVSCVLTKSTGATASVTAPKMTAFEDNSFGKMELTTGLGITCLLNLSNYSYTKTKVKVGNLTYTPASGCPRYILYYVNDYGGIDHLVIEGTSTESDTLTRSTFVNEYDNSDTSNRNTTNYVNEIVKSWSLRTGLMTDDESSRMHHLINSTDVFLYDITAETYVPVVISDTSCEYKTFRNQGGKMFIHTINVQEARERIRR